MVGPADCVSGEPVTGPDAVVVGAGVNGLVAANLLADAGWSVVVLEQQATPGGAVRTDADPCPKNQTWSYPANISGVNLLSASRALCRSTSSGLKSAT